jgi:translation initiation factor 3 subunit L
MYSHTFPVLSERFFKGSSWPRAEAVAHLADNDHVFAMLYRELYFRHVYAASKPTMDQRRESWENYRDLFTVVLNSNLNMQLPNAWLWDMIDEFVYQFQSFLQYRGKLAGKSSEEISTLQAADAAGVWAADAVVSFLEQLAQRSGMREELSTPEGTAALMQTEGYSATASNVLRMLGYFSLIGLLRVHCVLGDHTAGLRALAPLNPHVRTNLFATKIPMAAITMAYYCGFGYLALQRHIDAATCFSFGCSYVARIKSHAQRGHGYEQILKKNEQMYALLAVTLALCPAASRRLDEAVAMSLREKYGEKTRSMASGSVDAFEELFAYACPKFAAARAPQWSDANANTNAAAYKAQLSAFMGLVEERRHLPALKQFLRLYSSIPVVKLASLAELDEAALKSQLKLLEASSSVVTWPGHGDALAGEVQACEDVAFAIESQGGQEMVVVKESKATAPHGDFLVRHIQKFEDIVKDLAAIPVPHASPSASGAAGTATGQPAVTAH